MPGILLATAFLPFGSARAANVPTSPVVPDYTFSNVTLWTVVGLGVLHHTDHPLRGYANFPFSREFGPYTASLAVYPILLVPHALDAGPNVRIITVGAAYTATQLAHIFAETPQAQYDAWADGSNVLGVTSPALGRVSQGVSLGLSASLLTHLAANVLDGVHYGFTWKRVHEPGTTPVTWTVAPGVGGVQLAATW